MSEALLMHRLPLALLTLGVFVWCYVRGGRNHLAIRRFGAGLLFPLGCLWLTKLGNHFHPLMWFALITYPAALSLPYGEDDLLKKLRARALFGAVVGAASAPLLLPLGLWWAWLFQVGLATAGSVFYGVTNPTSAIGEEGAISLCLVATVPFLLLR